MRIILVLACLLLFRAFFEGFGCFILRAGVEIGFEVRGVELHFSLLFSRFMVLRGGRLFLSRLSLLVECHCGILSSFWYEAE